MDTQTMDQTRQGSSSAAVQFMRTLQSIESAMDPAEMVALYDDHSTLWKPSQQDPKTGREGAQTFWSEYLAPFSRIRSEFNNVIENGAGDIVLEWVSDGELERGGPIRYTGVSLVRMEGGVVQYFRTYYDSAAFLGGKSVNEEQPTAKDTSLVSEQPREE